MADTQNANIQTGEPRDNSTENWEGGSVEFWENMLDDTTKDEATENVADNLSVDAQKAEQINVSVNGSDASPFTYDEAKGAEAESVSVEGEVKDAGPNFSFDGKLEDNGSNFSVRGDLENPDYTYDEAKGAEADPITVNGDLSHLTEQPQPTATENKTQEQGGPTTPDLSEGFKLSDEAKARLKDKFKDYSAVGIMERFASSKNPEDAFVAMFLGMMLYLPNKALEYIDTKEVEAKEKKDYIERAAQAHDAMVARGNGWSDKDQFNMVYKDFVDSFGNMPQMAANLRAQDSKLVEGLGLNFDKDGRLQGDLNDKQIEALTKRVIENNHFQTYRRKLSKDELNKMWHQCNNLRKAGVFARLGQEQAALRSAMQNQTQAAPQASVVTPTTPQVEPPTVENVAEDVNNVVEPSTVENAVEVAEVEKTVEEPVVPQQPTVEDLQVDTQALADETMRDKIISIDAQALDKRPPMNLQGAHSFNLSVTTPSVLKGDIQQFNVGYEGFKTREQETQAARDALTAAKQPRYTVAGNTQQISLTVGQERG